MNLTRCLLIAAIVLAAATAIAVRWRNTWARFKAGIPLPDPAKPSAPPPPAVAVPEWTRDRTAIFGAFADIAEANPDLTTAFAQIAQEEECA